MQTKKEWDKFIDSLKIDNVISDKKLIAKELKRLLIKSVKKRIPKKRFGILFSGGLDSSLIALICKQLKADFVCYSVGYYEESSKYPDDLAAAEKVAKKLSVKLKFKSFNVKESEKVIKETVKVVGLGENNIHNIINVGVGAVVVAANEIAKKDKIDTFFTGAGAEELFGGYFYQEKAKDVNKASWELLKEMHEKDLKRNDSLSKKLKINFLSPFLDPELIKFAMQIPPKYKITNEHKKLILREVAHKMGLYKKTAYRKKQAAQYGSRFDKAIRKLTILNGFDKKKLWLRSLV